MSAAAAAEKVPPHVQRAVLRELRALAARPPAGVRLQLSDDISDVSALLEGPAGTPYAGGVFRVRLAVGRDFPAAPPRATFLTPIFHPNVSRAGDVCVNTLKQDWRPDLGLEHVLLTLRCLLIAPNPESALNAEAGALLLERYDDYFARAKLLTDIHARPAPASAPTSASARRRDARALEPDDQKENAQGHSGNGENERGENSAGHSESSGGADGEGPCIKRRAATGAAPAPHNKPAKDKRRILKRL